jgi:hypothetical protein
LKTQIGNRHSTVAAIRETCACNGAVIAMEAAPQSELDLLGIKNVCSGKRREVFQKLPGTGISREVVFEFRTGRTPA